MAQHFNNDQESPGQGKRVNQLPAEIQAMILRHHLDTLPAKTISFNALATPKGRNDANAGAARTSQIVRNPQARGILLACKSFHEIGKFLIDKFTVYKLSIDFSRLDEAFRVWEASIHYDQARHVQLNINFGTDFDWKHPAFRAELDKITARLFDFRKAAQVDVAYSCGGDHFWTLGASMDLRNELAYGWGKTLRTLPSITGSDQIFVSADHQSGQGVALSHVVVQEKRGKRWQMVKRNVMSVAQTREAFRRYGFEFLGSGLDY